MAAAIMIAADEHSVRAGPNSGPAILFILPLFDEANRLRRTIRLAMAALADAGIGVILPDLPGQNESLISTQDVTLEDWRSALAMLVAAENRPIITASLRGGCLLDDASGAVAHWRCTPAKGSALLRIMLRTRLAADKECGVQSDQASLISSAAQQPLELGGNLLSSAMIAQLQSAEPLPCSPCRTVAIDAEADGVDGHISGSPLWLRAEPGENAQFAAAIAADVIAWGRTCGVI
jgi:hypothetical protein